MCELVAIWRHKRRMVSSIDDIIGSQVWSPPPELTLVMTPFKHAEG